MKNGWTAGQYTLFRIVFGAYLFVHFLQLLPWGGEVFSREGVLPEASASPLTPYFPNVLSTCDSPAFVTGFIALGALLSVVLLLGKYDRPAAVGLWYIWTCLLGRNPLISNPSIPYVGWILLAHACLSGAGFSDWIRRGRLKGVAVWRMPAVLFGAAWAIMALGYTYSGFTKLMSPSWADGTALMRMLSNPLGRPGPVHAFLLAIPPAFLMAAAWGALGLELLFAPLALLRRLRPWLWALLAAMHLLLIVLVDFADLSLGMLMLHFFTFDPAWIRPRRASAPDIVHYDGGCGLCHGFVRFVISEDARGDALYDAFAKVRRRLASPPEGPCPLLPTALRARFSQP